MQGFEKPCINVGKVSIYEIKNVRNFKYHKVRCDSTPYLYDKDGEKYVEI